MARYYFDITDGGITIDDVGSEHPSFEAARAEAIAVLPDIARDYLVDGDTRVFEVIMRDEVTEPVFRATLTFECERLP